VTAARFNGNSHVDLIQDQARHRPGALGSGPVL